MTDTFTTVPSPERGVEYGYDKFAVRIFSRTAVGCWLPVREFFTGFSGRCLRAQVSALLDAGRLTADDAARLTAAITH